MRSQPRLRLQKRPTYWIPLLSAATSSPDPGRILQEFLKESRRAEELRRQWRQTLVYPLVVLCAAAAVMIFLSIVVIPVFRDIFSEFGLKLPWLTMSVMTLSSWLTSGRILIVVALLIVLGLFVRWLMGFVPRVIREFVGDWFGTPLGRWTAIARFYQFLADLLEAELEPAHALRLAGYCGGEPAAEAGRVADGRRDERRRRSLAAIVSANAHGHGSTRVAVGPAVGVAGALAARSEPGPCGAGPRAVVVDSRHH